MIFTEEYINTQKVVYTLLNRLEGVAFIEIMRGLELKMDKAKYPNSVFFFKDGLWYFELSTESGDLWCRYDKVWAVFTDKHNLSYSQTKAFIQEMVKEHWLRKTEAWNTHSSSDFSETEDHFHIQKEEEYYKGEIIPTPLGAKNFSAETEIKGLEKNFKDICPKGSLKETAKEALEIDDHFKAEASIRKKPGETKEIDDHFKIHAGGKFRTCDYIDDYFKEEINPRPDVDNTAIDEHFKGEVTPKAGGNFDYTRNDQGNSLLDEHFKDKEVEPKYHTSPRIEEDLGKTVEKHFKGVNSKNHFENKEAEEHFKNLKEVNPKDIHPLQSAYMERFDKVENHFKGEEINATLDWERSNEEQYHVEDHFKEVNPKRYPGENSRVQDHFNKKDTQPEK